jgi:hypothetical protein
MGFFQINIHHNKQRFQRYKQTGCVTLWPCYFTLKSILKGKRRILETLKYFTMQKYNLQNNPLKQTKILQEIITL